MENQTTISEQIDAIIADQYNNWEGEMFIKLKKFHISLRLQLGDYSYLEYLKMAKLVNPRPKYNIPKEYNNTIKQS